MAVKPHVSVITREDVETGEIVERRRQYAYPADDEAGVPGYTDSLDLLGEWEGKRSSTLDAEMAKRYTRFVDLILDPPAPEKAEPVDPAAAGEALDLAAAALQQAQDAITALRTPADPEA